jgi:hypothetical protein
VKIKDILTEFFYRPPTGYYNLANDNSRPDLRSLRRSRLTLRQLNRLNQLRQIQTYERAVKLAKIKRQYGQTISDDDDKSSAPSSSKPPAKQVEKNRASQPPHVIPRPNGNRQKPTDR